MRYRGRIRIILLSLILAAAASGCATSTGELRKLDQRLDFVEPGKTSRQAIIERFGEPSDTYEEGRLAVYIFVAGQDEPEIGLQHPAAIFGPHLVLEFDDQGTVKRFGTLVPP